MLQQGLGFNLTDQGYLAGGCSIAAPHTRQCLSPVPISTGGVIAIPRRGRFDGRCTANLREKFSREISHARRLAQDYFKRYPKDRYETKVES
jgi:hypothetical protein